jgi:23S rRNA U2552 (ribose-2'-O)-methylase RlmE/FtsJ
MQIEMTHEPASYGQFAPTRLVRGLIAATRRCDASWAGKRRAFFLRGLAVRLLGGKPVDLVISDMAPNLSGMNDIDQPRAMHLIDLAVDFAEQALRPGGALLMKVFQGEGFNELLQQLRQNYAVVLSRKPEASRARSREVYLLARDKKA